MHIGSPGGPTFLVEIQSSQGPLKRALRHRPRGRHPFGWLILLGLLGGEAAPCDRPWLGYAKTIFINATLVVRRRRSGFRRTCPRARLGQRPPQAPPTLAGAREGRASGLSAIWRFAPMGIRIRILFEILQMALEHKQEPAKGARSAGALGGRCSPPIILILKHPFFTHK